MMRTFFLLAAVMLALPWGSATAQRTYKWIDSEGRISYHDRPPPAGSGYRVEVPRIRSGTAAESSSEAPVNAPPVVLYSVPACDACDLARGHLKKRSVPFSEKNVEKDYKLQQELKQKAGTLSVPTITVGDKVLNTYSPGWLDSELDRVGYPKEGGEQAVAESEPAQPESDETAAQPEASTGGLAPTE